MLKTYVLTLGVIFPKMAHKIFLILTFKIPNCKIFYHLETLVVQLWVAIIRLFQKRKNFYTNFRNLNAINIRQNRISERLGGTPCICSRYACSSRTLSQQQIII